MVYNLKQLGHNESLERNQNVTVDCHHSPLWLLSQGWQGLGEDRDGIDSNSPTGHRQIGLLQSPNHLTGSCGLFSPHSSSMRQMLSLPWTEGRGENTERRSLGKSHIGEMNQASQGVWLQDPYEEPSCRVALGCRYIYMA